MLKSFVQCTLRQTRTHSHTSKDMWSATIWANDPICNFSHDTNAFTTINSLSHTRITYIGHICVNNVIVDFNIKYTFSEYFKNDKKALWVHPLYICEQNLKGTKKWTQSEQWQYRHWTLTVPIITWNRNAKKMDEIFSTNEIVFYNEIFPIGLQWEKRKNDLRVALLLLEQLISIFVTISSQ